MKAWSRRPFEIRNLFNPAFCGLVLFRALRAFEDEDARGMPFSLCLLILPLSLQRESRETLAKGNRSYFLKVVTAHPQMLVEFPRRASDMIPFAFEALGLLMQMGVVEVTDQGRLRTRPEGVRKTDPGSAETIACQKVARYLGKQFAQIGDTLTIYATLGVRP